MKSEDKNRLTNIKYWQWASKPVQQTCVTNYYKFGHKTACNYENYSFFGSSHIIFSSQVPYWDNDYFDSFTDFPV